MTFLTSLRYPYTNSSPQELVTLMEEKKGETCSVEVGKIKLEESELTIKKLMVEVHHLKHDKQYLYFLTHKLRYHQPYSPIYSMYLKEQLISFQIRAITIGNLDKVRLLERFVL
jgi:hypothetical protein